MGRSKRACVQCSPPWFERQGVRTLSAAIALAGLSWFIERVL